MIKYIKEILIVALVLWIASKYIFDSPEIITNTVTKVVKDTVTVTITTKPEIKWVEKEVADTAKVNELNSLIDSLQAEMNKLIDSTGQVGEYRAEAKEEIKNTAGEVVGNIDVTAVSRIPLDPDLFFLIKASTINTTIKETITVQKKTFWSRFGVSVQTGIGMGLITKQWDFYTGVGVHFEIL